LLPGAGELRLRFGKFLACSLQPTLQVSYPLVAVGQVTRSPGKLRLQFRLLALCLRPALPQAAPGLLSRW
jgi:hypothetical protein